ncbi:MAG: 3'-5' exoribonuclease [Clostridia bacterium]|nr:3'-5' exoribonuclease [Clostridia bacterium]
MLNCYIALDIETTGLYPDRDKIIEIGMVRVERGQIIDRFQTLVQPHQPLSVMIRRLTGITDQMLENAPEIAEVLPRVLDFIQQDPVLGHNIAFDCNFIEMALQKKYFSLYYDTLELARLILPAASSHRLGDLCQQLQIPLETTHRALDDAIYATKLYQELQKMINNYDLQKLNTLAAFLEKADSAWAGVIRQTAIGSSWFEQSPLEAQSPPDKIAFGEFHDQVRLEEKEVLDCFKPQGLLAKKMSAYQVREQQIRMVQKVTQSFNENKILVAEAGTGTGKSMAYLVPALKWAALKGKRVVISTRTISLQEQLWKKDLPFLQEALQLSITAALAKGRQNYICLRKWQQVLADADNCTPKEALFYARILIWLSETQDGDRSQLNLFGAEPDFWTALGGDSETCLGNRCAWFKRGCFILKARRKAEAAQIIITNHALLFADLKAEKRILPTYGPLIVDEAHHLEDAAMEQLGSVCSRNDLGRWLFRIGKLLNGWQQLVPLSDASEWQKLLETSSKFREMASKNWRLFFDILRNYFLKKEIEEGRIIRRLKLEMFYTEHFPQVEYDNLLFSFKNLLHSLKDLSQQIQLWAVQDFFWESFGSEAEQIFQLGLQKLQNLEASFSCKDSDSVYWVEVMGENENANLILHSSPLKVDNLIYASLFAEERPVIMTSATLTINRSFDYFCQSVGLKQLPENTVLLEQLGSPFNFSQQLMLGLVRHLPGQGAEGNQEYVEALAEVLDKYIKIMGGRTLVLFTSHRLLKRMYLKLKESLEKEDICLLGHNIDGGRWRLVEELKSSSRAVIFGASSFWEGVDIPGEALRCVIIVKLPFLSPGVPIVEARQEYLQEQNLNAFAEYSLPQAVLRFKQGFGRLIRTEKDRGAVIVLDERIVTKGYGRFFRNSLPVKHYIEGDIQAIAQELRKWS